MYLVRIQVQIVVDQNHYNWLDWVVAWIVLVLCARIDYAEDLRIGSR